MVQRDAGERLSLVEKSVESPSGYWRYGERLESGKQSVLQATISLNMLILSYNLWGIR